MIQKPAILRVTAAITWAGAVALAAADVDLDIVVVIVAAAGVSSLAELIRMIVSASGRTHAALTRSLFTRPEDGPMTPAAGFPALRAVQHGGQHSGHGRHAMR